MKNAEQLLSEGYVPLTCVEKTLTPNGDALYYIHENGSIYSMKAKRELKAHDNGIGYMQVYLTYFYGGGSWFKLHRLLALQFIPNPLGLSDVNHINGIKRDNRVENLEWLSHRDNIKHSYAVLGRIHDASYLGKKIKCSNGKEYKNAVEAANDTGCKTSNISMCCNGKSKQTKGYVFEFVL